MWDEIGTATCRTEWLIQKCHVLYSSANFNSRQWCSYWCIAFFHYFYATVTRQKQGNIYGNGCTKHHNMSESSSINLVLRKDLCLYRNSVCANILYWKVLVSFDGIWTLAHLYVLDQTMQHCMRQFCGLMYWSLQKLKVILLNKAILNCLGRICECWGVYPTSR